MKPLSLLAAAVLAVVFALPAHAAGKKHAAAKSTPLASSIDMVRIPAGSFTMGCQDGRDSDCFDREKPAHTVNLAAFELGKYEVMQGQWKAVMGTNPSESKDCGDACPVEKVSWDDIQTFIQKLNAKTGKTYRLPSEAEWEYACRAGKNTKYCGGNNPEELAWYDFETHPVGGKQANAWGLHDMSGNVREWVQDAAHDDNYTGAPADGSAWIAYEGHKMLRGGSKFDNPRFVRAASRTNDYPSIRLSSYGFRLARTLP